MTTAPSRRDPREAPCAPTNVAIRALQPKEKEYLEPDGGSFYLLVKPRPSGAKLWRFRFRFNGKQGQLSIGAYPAVSLAGARAARDAAKLLLAQGIDPAAAKQARKAPAFLPAAPRMPTLQEMALAYVGKRRREGAASSTMHKYDWSMQAIGDDLLDRPLDQVTKADMLARLRLFEATGHLEKVKRARTLVARVYDFAGAEGHEVARVPVDRISKSLAAPRATHHAALIDLDDVGELLRAMDTHKGDPSTMTLLRLSPLLVLRSSEIRALRWGFASWDDGLIRIPGALMKVTKGGPRDHIVPLSPQARAELEAAKPWSLTRRGAGGGDQLVMPSLRSEGRMVSENTFNAACRRMGYEVGTVTHHGLRTTFSTLMNEAGWNRDWVETQLHHLDPNQVRGAYNAAVYLEGRRTMMAAWADVLDGARAKPPRRGLACCRFRGHDDKVVTLGPEDGDEAQVQPRVQARGGEAGDGARGVGGAGRPGP